MVIYLVLEKHFLREVVVGNHCLLGSLFSERFTLGLGCLAVDDATTICLMGKPKDLQRWSVLFQYNFYEQFIGLTFQVCTSRCLRGTLLKR